MKVKYKRFVALLILTAVILLPVWYYNNFTIATVTETITSGKVNGEIKIVTISDLHAYNFGKNNATIIRKISELSPDLIFCLGDMYSRGQTRKIDESVIFLERLAEIADVYVVTGDHDTDDEYKEKLRSVQNITLLSYEKEDINVNGNTLSVYGIDNVYFSATFDLINEFSPPTDDKLNILLSHIPAKDKFDNFGFDFIFCGDTHGGMIRLPFLDGLHLYKSKNRLSSYR